MLWLILFATLQMVNAFPTPSDQVSFSIDSSSRPTKYDENFPRHLQYHLNDGNWLPAPAFGLGSVNKFKNVTEYVVQALDSGWRHFDEAAYYGNEQYLGSAWEAYGIPRSELFITTKFDGLLNQDGKTDVEKELKISLEKLRTDYVDLYLIHFPGAAGNDPKDTWRQLEQIKDTGLARSIGVSNYGKKDLAALLEYARILPVVNQVQYHGYNFDKQDEARFFGEKEAGILTEAYGSLTPVTTYPGGPIEQPAKEIAKRLGSEVETTVTTAQVAFTWLRTKGIVGLTTTSSPKRLEQSIAPWQKEWPLLTPEEVEQYDEAGRIGPKEP